MVLSENIQDNSLEEIISQFDWLYERQEIEDQISEMWVKLEQTKKDKFIIYIQNANSSGWITKNTQLKWIFKPDWINEINEIFTKIQKTIKNQMNLLLENKSIVNQLKYYIDSINSNPDSNDIELIESIEKIIIELKNVWYNVNEYEKILPNLEQKVYINNIIALIITIKNEELNSVLNYDFLISNIKHIKTKYNWFNISKYENQLTQLKEKAINNDKKNYT